MQLPRLTLLGLALRLAAGDLVDLLLVVSLVDVGASAVRRSLISRVVGAATKGAAWGVGAADSGQVNDASDSLVA